jgi:PAS domain S-box-containing protein
MQTITYKLEIETAMINLVAPVLLDRLISMLSNKDVMYWYKIGFKHIGILSTDGVVLYISDNCKELLGVNNNTIIGKCVFDFVHPSESETVMSQFARILVTKRQIATNFTVKASNGEWINIHAKCVPKVKKDKVVAIVLCCDKNVKFFNEYLYCNGIRIKNKLH